MDQSASVFGQRGSALYVSFKPELQATPITFPTSEEIVFVVAQSFVQADKHTTGPIHYNLRVVECTLAAVLLAKIFRLKELHPDSSPLGVSLRTAQDAFFEQRGLAADNETTNDMLFATQLEKMTELVEDYILQEEGYSREELSEILGLTIEELEEKFMSKFPVRAERFMLRQRALHVFREALRVIRFKSLLDNPPAENLLKELGSLMNDTQDSCRDVYECSCPELDELCQLARGAGSYGSRLTGAGWGGCSVHLVPKDKVEKVSQVWIDKYYKKKWPDISEEKLKDAIVVSKPSSGSFLFEIVGDNVV
jgi:galactokinase